MPRFLQPCFLLQVETFDPQTALRWAIGGFLAVNLAPAVGLPPELPGMGGAHLAERQIWWVCTALGTGLGLYLITNVRHHAAIGIGLLAIVRPSHHRGASCGGCSE